MLLGKPAAQITRAESGAQSMKCASFPTGLYQVCPNELAGLNQNVLSAEGGSCFTVKAQQLSLLWLPAHCHQPAVRRHVYISPRYKGAERVSHTPPLHRCSVLRMTQPGTVLSIFAMFLHTTFGESGCTSADGDGESFRLHLSTHV